MKYYLIAGERSGDLHGSNLIKALREQDPSAQFRGLGGHYMQEAGATLYMDYRDIAIMGIVDVLKNLLKFRALLHDCARDILQFDPRVVILIDFGGFNLRLAKILKKNNRKVFYYISPKIWAWNQNRAFRVKKYVDHMFCILPFEQDFYRKFGVETHFVGNPVLDAVRGFKPDDFYDKYNVEASKPLIALLPGSRKHEVKTTLPIMLALIGHFPEHQFGVSVVSNIPEELYEAARDLPNVRLIREDNYNLLANACCAVVASGTATLETALLKVPQVVVYRLGRINWLFGQLIVNVKYISLVNLIMDRLVVKELLQKDLTLGNLVREVDLLANNKQYIAKMMDDYHQLTKRMGDQNASAKAAAMMTGFLKDSD